MSPPPPVRAGEHFPSELGPDGAPAIPDDALLEVDRAALEAWDGAEPLPVRVVDWGRRGPPR